MVSSECMAVNAAAWVSAVETWTVVAVHDWQGTQSIETTLANALATLTDTRDDVLYDHVDLEALSDVVGPNEDRGASEVRFDYGPYEVRIEGDGTVAIR